AVVVRRRIRSELLHGPIRDLRGGAETSDDLVDRAAGFLGIREVPAQVLEHGGAVLGRDGAQHPLHRSQVVVFGRHDGPSIMVWTSAPTARQTAANVSSCSRPAAVTVYYRRGRPPPPASVRVPTRPPPRVRPARGQSPPSPAFSPRPCSSDASSRPYRSFAASRPSTQSSSTPLRMLVAMRSALSVISSTVTLQYKYCNARFAAVGRDTQLTKGFRACRDVDWDGHRSEDCHAR